MYEAVWEEKVARREWKSNPNNEELKHKWKDKKRVRKKRVRKHQRAERQKLLTSIEQLRSKDPKEYWRRLKQLSDVDSKKKLPNKMKNEENEWVFDKKGIEEVWARAFEKLGEEVTEGQFDEEFAEQIRERVKEKASVLQNNINDVIDQEISIEEVRRAIKHLKRGKAVGVDNYMNEIFMYGGEKIEEATWKLCKQVFSLEVYPETWARGLIFPIFKGGSEEDKYNPLKYRGITLLSVLGKLYTAILNERVNKWIEMRGILVKEQAGFRKNRSTVDQLFILTELIKNRRGETYVCFIDIQKAYDRVWRDGLWEKLYEYGMTGKMWRVLRNIYDSVESSVLVNDRQSRFFSIDTGLRQGCLLSPILFAIYINGLAEEITREKLGAKIVKYSDDRIGILMYADDSLDSRK